MNYKSTSILLLLLLSGCANQPRQVNASIPLVSENNTIPGRLIAEIHWPQLNKAEAVFIENNDYLIQAEPTYLSALGIKCRVLLLTPKHKANVLSSESHAQIKRVACQAKASSMGTQTREEWYLMNDVVDGSTSIKL